MGIDIKVGTQTIIVPLGLNKPAWVFSIASLGLKSSKPNEDIYEFFDLDISKMNMYYSVRSSGT